jgi:hypothetical protein
MMEIKTPFFNMRTGRAQVQEMEGLRKQVVKLQELIVQDNILTVQQNDATYSGNRYKTYDTAILALALAYAGGADWGVLQVGNIIDLRAAYIVGQGIKVSKVEAEGDDATPEYEFAQRFIDKNELDHELPQDLAREAEIEGKTLLKLFPVKSDEEAAIEGTDIVLRWVSWTSNKYTVKVSAADYLQLESVEWDKDSAHKKLLPEQCVFKRFGGRLDIPNETMPRTAKCLTQIENLDMALRDWRQINKLYAAPTPHIQCENAQQAKEINEAMDKINWKIGKFFAHTGVFGYAQPSSEGQKAIESEIITLMKLISGTTGVPINALGAPELTTKLGADSQAQLDLIAMSTAKEREIWKAAYQEAIEKAMLIWNAETGKTPLRPELIKVDLPVVTEAQWNRIVSTWLPMLNSTAITQKTFLNQVPGLDVEAELEALAGEDTAGLDKFTNQPDDPNADPNAEDNPPADNAPQGNLKGITGQVLKYKSNPGNFKKAGA